MKKLKIVILAFLLTAQSISASKSDWILWGTASGLAVVGGKLIFDSRKEITDWHKSRDDLLYNQNLSDRDWIIKYDKRNQQKKNTDRKTLYGVCLIATSGILIWGWWETRTTRIQLNNKDLGVTFSLKF